MSGAKDKRMVVVPDYFSAVDRIGYSEHSAGLVEMIHSVEADGSFTIGVFGQWGQGKTSMLRQIESQLNKPKKSGVLTVWFNPWQFSGEEHVIIPFFHTLVSYLQDFEKDNKGKKIAGKVGKFLKELIHVPIALAYGIEGKIKIPLLLETRIRFKEIIKEARKKKIELNEKSLSEFDQAIDQYESLYYRLISKLQDAARELKQKIVVFIDDLDRCLPEKAVELLEGIKVLLDIPGFVFVIGVSREVIERGIRVRYRELYQDQPQAPVLLEQDYLDKIIQFPFPLPPADRDKLREMVAGYLEDLKEVQPYLCTIHNALGNNPRSLKRFINNLSYTFWVAEKRGSGEDMKPFSPELLVKMTLIAFVFPRLYQVIGNTPGHLLRIQAFLKQKADTEREGKVTDTEKEIPPKEPLGEKAQNPNEFIEINELNLFGWPNLDNISAILAIEKRIIDGKEEKDKGFGSEDEVDRYVRLVTVTAASEKAAEPTDNIFRQTMESRMVHIPGGTIRLKDEDSGNRFDAEVSPFLLDKYPLTQDLYWKVTGKKPSRFKGDDRPVESVSWFDAVELCNLLSQKAGLEKVYTIKGDDVTCNWQAKGFRLPSEAEWEYACRAGSVDERYGDIDQIAWYKENSEGSTHGVGLKVPNEWGLYDMLGNVLEWCWDWYEKYPTNPQKDWRGPGTGSRRVVRGGSWRVVAQYCRASYRLWYPLSYRRGFLGFRLARSL